MTSMAVPAAPALSHLADVELAQTGTWAAASGPVTFTSEDFMAAVAALDCPAVRRPCLKLGHVSVGEPGEPAIGYIDNMRGSDDWRTLVGDYAGMPGWLATPDENGNTVIASAFPDRSIEGAYGWRCQMGHTHPFVITAVALLGAKMPAVGTLASLQDIGKLYGVDGTPELVAASAKQDARVATSFTVPVTAGRKDQQMPNPTARQVAATVTSDDVRRAFYESPIGSDWDAWIEEIQLDPLQIIYIDDDEGARYRVPVTIGAGDGPDAITFGDPVQVVIRYEDTGSGMVAAAAGTEPIRFASRAESRPGKRPTAAAPQTPAEPQETPPNTPEEADAMSDTLIKGLRERLGVTDETLDEAGLLAALDETLAEHAEPVAASTPEANQELAIVKRELEKAQAQIGELVTARASDESEKRSAKKSQLFAAAFAAGKIGGPTDPERVEFEKDYDEAPAVIERILAGRAAGSKFPVKASGYTPSDDEKADPASGDNYWFAGTAKPALTNAGD